MADEIKTVFNDAFSDGPYDNPDKVDKPAARRAGATVQAQFDVMGLRVDGIEDDFNTLSDAVEAIDTGSAEGIIVEATLANLNARAASLGLGAANAGRSGRVYQDGTAANNGDYRWTGSAWSFLGLDRLGKVEAAVGAPLAMFRQPLNYDAFGATSSGVRKIWVPRQLYARRGNTVLNGTYGIASTSFPLHVELTIDGNEPAVVYLDLDDTTNPQKITNWASLPSVARPDKIVVIAEIFQYRIKTPHAVVSIEDPDKEHISFRWPIAVDGEKVLVPPFYHYAPNSGFTFYTPSSGELYWELDLNIAQTSEWRYYFDRIAAEAGDVPVKVANSGSARPLAAVSKGVLLEFGRCVNKTFTSEHLVVGGAGSGAVANMLVHGNDPDLAPLYDPGATIGVDISNVDLVALGFTRGFGGDRPMPRLLLPEGTPKKGWGDARVRQLASADNVFVTPTIYIHDGKGGNLTTRTMVLEKKISSRVAIYRRMFDYDLLESPASITVGVIQSSSTVNPVVMTGFQIYLGPQSQPYIMRSDFGRRTYPDILYPAKHYSVSGRGLPFFREGLITDRQSKDEVLAYSPGDNLSGIPFVQQIGEGTLLDYANVPSTLNLMVGGSRLNPAQRANAAVASIRASGTMSGAFNVLCIGDSNTNREVPSRLRAKLIEMGFTPTMLGTMANEGGQNGEGRGSWEWDDFYGADAQFPAVPIGGEAAYLALSAANGADPGRWANNPFLRPQQSGDNAAHVFNGNIFDIQSYLARFSVATPKFVPILLGTNDINLNSPAQAVAQVLIGMQIMTANILSKIPSAYVGVGVLPMPRSVVGDTKWQEAYALVIRTIIQYVVSQANSRLDVLPVWAHMSPTIGWSLETKQTYANRTLSEITDELHPVGINRSFMAECLAQWIACRQMGL